MYTMPPWLVRLLLVLTVSGLPKKEYAIEFWLVSRISRSKSSPEAKDSSAAKPSLVLRATRR